MYHPDLQENASKKEEYEEKLKLINEAYETLSNEQKRKQYDLELEQIEQMKRQQENVENSYSNFNNSYNPNVSNTQYQNTSNYDTYDSDKEETQRMYEEEYNRQVNEAINKAYHDAYIQDLKNRGYRIRYKKTFKDYIRTFISIVIFLFILFVLWHSPFVNKYFKNLYEENIVIQTIVDLFYNIITSFKTN